MVKWRIPFLTPYPRSLPSETLGDSLENVQHAIDVFDHFDYRNDSFLDRLNDDAIKILGDMDGYIEEIGCISKEELITTLLNRIKPKLTSDMKKEGFNHLLKNEAIALFNDHYSSTQQTCFFVVAGLMITVAIVLIEIAPETAIFVDDLISDACILAAVGCTA